MAGREGERKKLNLVVEYFSGCEVEFFHNYKTKIRFVTVTKRACP